MDTSTFTVVASTVMAPWIDPTLLKQLTANLISVAATLLGLISCALAYLLRWLIATKIPWLLRGMAKGMIERQVVQAEEAIQDNTERFKTVAASLRAKSPYLAGLTDEQIQPLVEAALKATETIRKPLQ